ncbi:MAG: alpha-hydroxy-acid oxidizing protein, partial [Bradyrhizobium sp.]|uniref:alpha-hydroxy acid oxidase n=1 Tax=Bradyrhizobium sp. TaxID=376 RepID=UPI001DEED9A0|nr:alpha-hydroxy-acid oxidizing protein [Bradyrhizobium sp.]
MTSIPESDAQRLVARSAARPAKKASRRMRRVLALDDLEPLARSHLPRPIFGFISGAAETITSLKANREAFQDYAFIPRVLVDTSTRSQAKTLFCHEYAAPFGISPMGASALAAYRGDLVLARVASQARIPFILSASSLIRLEEVREAGQTAWFQAYLPGEPARIASLMDRVANAG